MSPGGHIRGHPNLVAGLSLALAGCGARYTLHEVPIEGATPAQEAVLRQVLLELERDLTPGRVYLRVVRLVDDAGPELGSFTPATSAIRLDRTLPDPELVVVLRHEVCHALHDDLSQAAEGEVWSELAVGLSAGSPVAYDEEEAFASLCEQGSVWSLALSDGCPGDAPLLSAAAHDLLERVWWAPPSRIDPGLGPEVALSLIAAEGVDFHVHPGEVLGVESSAGAGEEAAVHVDLSTGLPVGDVATAIAAPATPPPTPAGWWWHAVAGSAERGLGNAHLTGNEVGGSGLHLVGWSDPEQRWIPLAGPCPGLVAPFAVGDDLWLGWSDAGYVRWALTAL